MATSKKKRTEEPAVPEGAVLMEDHLRARSEEMKQYNREMEAAGLGRAAVVAGGGPGAAPGTPGSTGGSGTSSPNTNTGAGVTGGTSTGGTGGTTGT